MCNKTALKVVKTIALTLVVSIIIYYLISAMIFMYNINIEKSDCVDDLFSKNYVSYNGGEDAQLFFEEYLNLEGYKDVKFHYMDGEKIIALYNFFTVFVVDVYYENEQFFELSNTLIQHNEGVSAEAYFNEYDGLHKIAFSGFKIKKSDTIYQNNTAAIMFDPRYYTIRYAFLVNEVGSVFDVQDSIVRSLDLNFNVDENDWVFDYSDLSEKNKYFYN